MFTEIKSYRIFLDSGTQKNRSYTSINLYDTQEEVIGVLQFYEEGERPEDHQDIDRFYIQYPISKFSLIIDILRNEKPLFVGYWQNQFGQYGRIFTGKEPVGEGELDFPVKEDQTI